jgi:HEAT repeat protein
MGELIAEICNSDCPLGDAVQRAAVAAQASPGFEFELSKFLQAQCMETSVDHPTVFRGLEVLGGMLDEPRLVPFMRPFLRSKDSQVASKSVLILGRQSRSLVWMTSIHAESDDRVRANLVESLWDRREPEVEQVLQGALRDPHHRVVANAVYGLYLMDSDVWVGGLDRLLRSHDPIARRSAIWVIKSAGGTEAGVRLKPLIRDPDPSVRRAAFAALVSLRGSAERRPASKPAPREAESDEAVSDEAVSKEAAHEAAVTENVELQVAAEALPGGVQSEAESETARSAGTL